MIGIACISVTILQCCQLFDNFTKRETLRKVSEKFLDGDIVTPMIIICGDPPQGETDEDMIMIPQNKTFPIKRIKTMFKVTRIGFPCYSILLLTFSYTDRGYVT